MLRGFSVLTWLWFSEGHRRQNRVRMVLQINMYNAERRVCAELILLPTTRFAPFNVVLIPHGENRYDNAEYADHREEGEIERNIRQI
jgi:hypothetical protein